MRFVTNIARLHNKTTMSFVGELKYVIFFGRLMGIAPYKIVETHLQLSPIAIFYSIIIHFVYTYLTIRRLSEEVETFRMRTILEVTRIVLVSSSLPMSFLLSITRHETFCAFINIINKFDGMTNIWRDGITRKRKVFVWACIIVPIGICVTVQMFYNCNIQPNGQHWRLGFTLQDIGFGTIISLYSIMISCVLRRFQHLNRLFIPGQADTAGLRQCSRKHSELYYAWIFHADLVEASEQLNSMFNYQSSICFTLLGLNVIMRLYNLWNWGNGVNTWVVANHFLSIGRSVYLLIVFIALCHITAEEVASSVSGAKDYDSNFVREGLYWCDSDVSLPRFIKASWTKWDKHSQRMDGADGKSHFTLF